MYRAIIGFFGLCAELFFRRRRVGDLAIPADGPVVIVANHPNGIIDPLIVTRTTRRKVRFLAKAPLFGRPIIGALLRRVRALPVYRQVDELGMDGNRGMFAAVGESLAAGEAICLFPEGVSHDEPELMPLKTGAARLVLGAEADRGWALGVRVVPLGITYRDKAVFRSEVATEIGAPLGADDLRDAYQHDPRAAVRTLTARIDEGLREVTLNLERWDDLPLLELAAAIRPADDGRERDPVARVRAYAQAARVLERHEPERVAALRRRIRRFDSDLRALGVPPERLTPEYRASGVARFVVVQMLALVIGVPVALAGLGFYALPFALSSLLARKVNPSGPLAATVKLLGAVLVYLVWHVAWTIASALILGWPGPLVVWLVMPPCGLYAIRYFSERSRALREARRFFQWISGRHRALILDLVHERDAIVSALDEAYAAYARLDRR